MNVALPHGHRPAQTKAEARGGHAGQTSSTSKNQRTSFGGKRESQRLRAFVCTAGPVRADREGHTRVTTIKKAEKNLKEWWKLMSTHQ